MRRSTFIPVLAAFACGGGQQGTTTEDLSHFDCKDRRMAYELTGGFGAHLTGVAVRCDDTAGAQIITFRQESADVEREVETTSMSPKAFDELWEKIDSTGWRHLESCDYLALDGKDTKYVIIIGDHAAETRVECSPEPSGASKKLQFPHDSIVNELDRAAGGLR